MDLSCIVASILFFVGNLFLLIFGLIEAASKTSNSDGFRSEIDLDADFIKSRWEFRRLWIGVTISSGLVNALAWVIFTIPMLQLAWILSLGGRRNVWMHAAIVILCLGSSFTEFISLLFNVGISNVGEWISKDINLHKWLDETNGGTQGDDNIGWRVLELSYTIFTGMAIWVEAFEWLAMFMILTLIYISSRSLVATGSEDRPSFTFGRCWAHLGLFIGLLSLIDFSAQVLRFTNWTYFTNISVFFGMLNRLILLPVWLCLLSCQLPAAANSIEMSRGMPDFFTKMVDAQDTPAPSSLNVESAQGGSNDDLMRSADGPVS